MFLDSSLYLSIKINALQSTLVLFLILAVLISFSVAYFQYYFRTKNRLKVTPVLFMLKGFSLFLLLLLLLNPTIEKTAVTNVKPVLSILVDNSKSTSFFKEELYVKKLLSDISNSTLSDKFDIQKFTFGNSLKVLDSLSLSESNTNISDGILGIESLQKDKISPIILITDGNQTIGSDYEFISSRQPVYPIVIGDTTKYVDIKISQLNVNKYSYIKNKFPVEVILNYEGDESFSTQFSIFSGGKSIYRKTVRFSATNKSETITANLTSTKEGLQYYTASVSKLENEKKQ